MHKFFPVEGKRLWIAGETGMVGRAILHALKGRDVDILSAPHSALDLTDQRATSDWLAENRPDGVIVAAARVGGIGANSAYPADFIRDNLSIALNVIDGAHRAGVDRLLFLGSSCIYPKEAAQPIREDALLTGSLEPTNEAYAIAKIAGLKLCEFYARQYGRQYISAMPTNLYGPYDNFDPETGHAIPAMIAKFHSAKMARAKDVILWGTGAPLREFLHVDDLARALITLLECYDGTGPVNVGSGEEISIRDLAYLIKDIVGYEGGVVFDPSKPDGTMRKALDSSVIKGLGWQVLKPLMQGLKELV
jgi:GDP-L-fucose synthase